MYEYRAYSRQSRCHSKFAKNSCVKLNIHSYALVHKYKGRNKKKYLNDSHSRTQALEIGLDIPHEIPKVRKIQGKKKRNCAISIQAALKFFILSFKC